MLGVQTAVLMGGDRPPTGVLVLRLWADGELPEDLRARVHATPDVEVDAGHTTAVAGRSQIIKHVAAWVDEYARHARDTRDDPDGSLEEDT